MSELKVAAINNPSAGSGGLAISTAGVVTGAGMDLITSQTFTAAASVSVNDCFTSGYENYLIVAKWTGTANHDLHMRFRAAATDLSSASSYAGGGFLSTGSGVTGIPNTGSENKIAVGAYDTGQKPATVKIDCYSPATGGTYPATTSTCRGGKTTAYVESLWITCGVTNAVYTADGFSLIPSSGTFTGTLRVYGLRN